MPVTLRVVWVETAPLNAAEKVMVVCSHKAVCENRSIAKDLGDCLRTHGRDSAVWAGELRPQAICQKEAMRSYFDQDIRREDPQRLCQNLEQADDIISNGGLLVAYLDLPAGRRDLAV